MTLNGFGIALGVTEPNCFFKLIDVVLFDLLQLFLVLDQTTFTTKIKTANTIVAFSSFNHVKPTIKNK
jgi:hypothetical protein